MTQPLSPEPPPAWHRHLVERAGAIILRPKATWEVIDAEAAPIRGLVVYYAVPLAAIGPVAYFLGGQIFGRGDTVLGLVYRPSLLNAVFAAILQYAFALIAVAVLAGIIQALARRFGGVSDPRQAFRAAIHGSTAFWLAGIFQLVPALAVLSIVGLYSLYLIYIGLPKMMNTPREQALIYVIIVVIAAIMVWIVAGTLGAALTPRAVI